MAVGSAVLAALVWWAWPSPAPDPSPAAQRAFCRAVEDGRRAWKEADAGPAAGRAAAREKAIAARNEAMVRALANDVRRAPGQASPILVGLLNRSGSPHPSGAASGWRGVLASAQEIPGSGALAYSVRLPCGAELVEFVPAPRGSAAFRSLSAVKTGSAVTFDGAFLTPRDGLGGFRESSATGFGAMLSPSFDFHVTAIAAAGG